MTNEINLKQQIINEYTINLNRAANSMLNKHPQYNDLIISYHRMYSSSLEQAEGKNLLRRCVEIVDNFHEEVLTAIEHIKTVEGR